MVLVGIVLAIVGVVLVSAGADDASGRPSGLGYGIAAGIGMGAFSFLISRVSHDHVFWPLVAVRGVEAVVFLAIVVVARPAWRVPSGLWPAIVGIGALDLLGNASYLTATHAGALAVAAVLSSLYPVVTVVLATVFLRERVTRAHVIGILTAAVAIALIAGGSAA
jgi:drug/metabolite transporter (DMT)-like permease